MSFTEFTCRSGGSNLYAGSLDGSAEASTTPLVTYTSGTLVASTGVFTVASGDPVAAGVTVGMYASMYADGASAPTGYVGRITGVTSTTITVSTTAKSGTSPTDGTGNRTLVVGGAWAGPNGASGFPFSFIDSALVNASGNLPRVNFKNDQTYSITAAITTAVTGVTYQGYTSTFGDLGRANLRGPATGASFIMLSLTGVSQSILDFDIGQCGNSGTQTGLSMGSAARSVISRVVVHDVRGAGFTGTGSSLYIECEAYACNQSNTTNTGGFNTIGTHINCISHHNTGSNTRGFRTGSNASINTFIKCISHANGNDGFSIGAYGMFTFDGCDAYDNAGDGIEVIGGSSTASTMTGVHIRNCNLLKNGEYGIKASGTFLSGEIRNCGFGAGTQANTSGATNIVATATVDVFGSVNYASNVTPWVDPANGDFRINLAAAKGAGRGAFLQTQSGYSGTVGYPDIGAAQHQDTGGAVAYSTLGRLIG